MNYPLFEKCLFRFHVGMGIYGFTRGFRTTEERSFSSLMRDNRNFSILININNNRKLVLSERFFEGFMNACYYSVPFFNLFPLYSLVNRFEISIRGLKKEEYKNYYKEPLSGYCFDTL